jgi:hypothetical protein
MKAGIFKFTFEHQLNELGHWDYESFGITDPFVEIYLPKIHFPSDSTEIWVSSGVFSLAPNEQRWFRLGVTPLGTEQGGAVVSHLNISKRKVAELAVQEGSAHLCIGNARRNANVFAGVQEQHGIGKYFAVHRFANP